MPRKNNKKVVVTEPEPEPERLPFGARTHDEPEIKDMRASGAGLPASAAQAGAPTRANKTKTKQKRINTEAQLEHLKKMREKAAEKKKQNKLEKEKIKDIEKLKTELKLKEYDKLKKKLDEPEPEGPIEEEKPKVKQDFSYNDLVDMNVKSILQNKIKEEKIKHVVNLLSPQTF